jgi:hypothetical protein
LKTDKLKTEGAASPPDRLHLVRPEGDPQAGRQPFVRDALRRAGELALQRLTRRDLNEPPSQRGVGAFRRHGCADVFELAHAAARRQRRGERATVLSMHVPQPNPDAPPAPPPEMPPTPDVVPPDIQDPPPTPHQQPPIVDPMPEPGPPNPIRALT